MPDTDGDGTPDDVDVAPYDSKDARRKSSTSSSTPASTPSTPPSGSTMPGPRTGSDFYDPNAQGVPSQHSAPNHSNASPTTAVWSVPPGAGNKYSSPRYMVGPNNEVMDDLNYGRDTKYGGYAEPFLKKLAKHMGQNRTASSIWNMAVDIAKRDGITVDLAIRRIASDAGFDPSKDSGKDGADKPRGRGPGGGSGSGSGSGGASASVSTNYADAFNVRAIADSVSMEMLGRGVSQDEMERILKRVRKYEANNPSVSQGVSGGGMSNTVSSGGTSSAGYQEVIKRMLAKNPEYGDYQAATTVMGWFDDWLAKRGQGVG